MNHLIFSFTILLSLLALTPSLHAQIGLPDLEKDRISYRSFVKKLNENDKIGLLVLYTEALPATTLPRITNMAGIISEYDLITDVVDPYDQVTHPIFRRARPKAVSDLGTYTPGLGNPTWLTIDRNNIVIDLATNLTTDSLLTDFVRESMAKSKNYHQALDAYEANDKDVTVLTDLIFATTALHEGDQARKYINRYLKTIPQRPNDQQLEYAMRMAEECNCGGRITGFILDHEEQIKERISEERFLQVRRRLIHADLLEKGQLEPYYVWREYERHLGTKADSLYRMYAIVHFAQSPLTKKELYDECLDYVINYPHTAWEQQDPIYNLLIQAAESPTDQELLLDLISGQLFRGEHYKKLDYRAYLLYKLGQKTRALELIARVNELALKEGVKYTSLMSTFNSDR
ncbi:MAG: hypothetical protein AAFR14_09330 [Bacteroidota bacterium]